MLKNWIVSGFLLSILGICGAGEVSAAYVHMFDCKDCHRSGLNYAALGVGNLCMSCHGEPPTIIKQPVGGFAIGDASHAFGHGNGNVADYQTSHTWSVSTDTVPAAGAQAPDYTTDREFYTRYGASSGRITCSRCHNPHALEGNPQLLVKGAGSGEAMCRACHVTWAQQTTGNHGLLSHPLVNDYASAASTNPSKYRTVPVNDRRGEIQLVGGGVACTSCHGMHFVDSNSDTDDGKAQLDPEYPGYTTGLAQGDGKLLRADGPRRANKSVLCQSCHTYSAHGGTTVGTAGCMVCHSGHSYDPVAPNYFVLRKTATKPDGTVVTDLNYSNAGVLVPADKYKFWNDRTDGTADGYCERCHGDAKDISDREYHVTNAVCTDCHKHNGELGAFGANCGACHGNADTDNAWPDGLANNILPAYAWADDAGSHAVHVAAIGTRNLSCPSCHPGNPPADHYLDATTGAQQAEVTRMDKDGNGTVDYWQFAEGATATGGTAVYFKTATAANDADAYYRATNQTCYNINCHGNVDLQWGTFGCLSCHATVQGSRTAVVGQFASNSHHVQGASLTAAHCYQCHWEANSDGSVNSMYHGGAFHPGSMIDLVVYGAGIRPAGYAAGTTAIQYAANGSRSEIAKLNGHCLSCHSDANNAITPFGDGKTPKQYAWDGTSVASRYSQTGATLWGKYADTPANNISPKNTQSKAYSAHGNAVANQGGWNLTETWPDTRNGTVSVACYDCHNSHGSNIDGKTTSYDSTTVNGGLLKETTSGRGGYSVSYKPAAGGTAENKDVRKAGASLCLDCHMQSSGGTSQPWGYQSTFGAAQKIMGYFDTPYLTPGSSGTKQRFPYRQSLASKGGHFGASTPLASPAMASIDGLCTPCHDPHGVSPSLGSNQPYGVPLLKGTWLTSPYLEDAAPQYNYAGEYVNSSAHIDQNTFGGYYLNLVTGLPNETDVQFAGLCLNCHPKSSLTDGVTHTWKSKDRVHESVKGWKTVNGNVKHSYSCSKCHTAHIGSSLPRLMVSNCFDYPHKGRTPGRPDAAIEGYDEWGTLAGRIPGWRWDRAVTCHDGPSANNFNNGGKDQSWNQVTPWYNETGTLAIIAGPTTGAFSNIGSNLRVPVSWTTTLQSNSRIDYGPTTSYGSILSNASYVTSHGFYVQNLANHSTYHYRINSQSFGGQTVTSADKEFYVSLPPTVPILNAEADVSNCSSGCMATLTWNASTDPVDNGPIQYYAELSTTPTFVTVLADSGWTSSTGWVNVPLPQTNVTYYWRVKSRDANYITPQDPPSAWSVVDNFIVSDGSAPQVTLLSPANSTVYSGYDGYYGVAFTWSSMPPAAEHLVQVSTDPNFAIIDGTSGWITTANWSTGLYVPLAATTTYYWRVQGKNAGVTGPWSPVWMFRIVDYGTSSCPLVFGWTGTQFDYMTDLAGPVLALKPTATDRSVAMYHPEVAVVNGLVPDSSGQYRIKIRESLPEVPYLDTVTLLAVDAPEGYEIHTSWAETTYVYGHAKPFQIYTSGNPLLPVSAVASDGTDVLASMLAVDNTPAHLDPFDPGFYYTVDFGYIAQPQYAKLLIDGWTLYGVGQFAYNQLIQPSIEVVGPDGNWVKVKSFGTPAGDLKTMVVDLSNLFLSGDRRIRIYTGMRQKSRWLIDRIRLDQSAPVEVSVQEVTTTGAGLRPGGNAIHSMGTLESRIIASDVNMPVEWGEPSYGSFTRYGDVTALLTSSDDMFAIMRQGDQVELTFPALAPPAAGLSRTFIVKSDLFYKSLKVNNQVEPLPFHGMSSYPYPEPETYPADEDHLRYREEYNTRIISP